MTDMTDDRRMLADSFARFVTDRLPIQTRNRSAYGDPGYDPEGWAGLAELGVVQALFPEEAGGFAGTGADIALVFEEVGRGLVVEPLLGALMSGHALVKAGGQEEPLASILSGEAIAAFAEDADAVAASKAGDGWSLSGEAHAVPHGDTATLILVAAQDGEGAALFSVDPAAIDREGAPTIDGGRSATLRFRDTPAERIGGAEAVDAAVAAGLLALSAEALGAMERTRDMTLDYLRTRQQFGVPIGRFQALQHRMADLLLEVEQMRSAVENAAAAFDGDDRRARDRMLSAAKYSAGRIGRLVAEEAVQMHGGIGMTWELPLSHYAKRLVMIDHQLGDEDEHLQRFIGLGQ